MQYTERDILLSKVCSPYLLFKKYKIYYPEAEHRYLSSLIYEEWYEKGKMFLWSQDDLLDYLLLNDIWSASLQEKLDGLSSDIDKLKIGLYENYFKFSEREAIRINLESAKEAQLKLLTTRHALDFLTIDFFAEYIRKIFLTLSRVQYKDKWLFNAENFLNFRFPLFYQMLDFVNDSVCSESELRELARTEPWRSKWNASSKANAFPFPIGSLSPNQVMLLVWSNVYDSVYSSMDCPTDEIINDDDALDGFFLLQKKKSDTEKNKEQVDNLTKNPKIANSQEVYVMAGDVQTAKKITEANDSIAKLKIKQRMQFLKEKGLVREQDFPDSQNYIREQFHKKYVDHVKKG